MQNLTNYQISMTYEQLEYIVKEEMRSLLLDNLESFLLDADIEYYKNLREAAKTILQHYSSHEEYQKTIEEFDDINRTETTG